MTDLNARLREFNGYNDNLTNEAADRIEALEAVIERAIRQAQNIGIDSGSYYEGLLAALGTDIGGGRG